eukprot:69346-Chlamydomonas_euryale.AAC.2
MEESAGKSGGVEETSASVLAARWRRRVLPGAGERLGRRLPVPGTYALPPFLFHPACCTCFAALPPLPPGVRAELRTRRDTRDVMRET